MTPNRIESYPIKVTITKDDVEVWSGSQKDLFSKYGHRAVPEIKANLQKFKDSRSQDLGCAPTGLVMMGLHHLIAPSTIRSVHVKACS